MSCQPHLKPHHLKTARHQHVVCFRVVHPFPHPHSSSRFFQLFFFLYTIGSTFLIYVYDRLEIVLSTCYRCKMIKNFLAQSSQHLFEAASKIKLKCCKKTYLVLELKIYISQDIIQTTVFSKIAYISWFKRGSE